jgi:valyl-tRNA synthetase
MEKAFDAASSEARWYKQWQEMKCFQPDQESVGKPVYSITIPPPNVTGSLHMGHALCYTIQDVLGRWKRMAGYNVLILPGVDHGGISTQNVVEKVIAEEGLTRHDLGRERFLERVTDWKDRYGASIVTQLQRLGCAFDWSRERYTMDEAYSEAVLEHFIRLFDQGLIYRGARVINWCPRCMTALSDIELEYVDRDTFLWHIRYPFSDGNGSITVATTRPETMLGDTAVAVNPNDPRYAGMHGRTITLPLTGREIPLIFDDYASMEFGTGAVKVTPAHDLNDFEAGRRNKLPQIVVIGEDGRMTAAAGDAYANLTREEAREKVEHDLEEQGFLVQKEPYRHSVGTCERCHTIVEPLLSEQWFVKMAGTPMIQRSIAAVLGDEIQFVPERYKRIYLDWMENIRDWCISRQLWWGHRIPIYYAPDGTYTAARSAEEAATKLSSLANTTTPPELGEGGQATFASSDLRQDEDVLDTWFSSDLWPFATLGWPAKTADLETFYPTDVLTTAREILYLWVARMIMMGLEFTGEIPFKDVYIYATVLDKQGRRMSKSLGNGIDPLLLIDNYGADALRFSLIRLASKGQDMRYSEERVPESRNFCTKIWNAARFVLMSLGSPPAPNSGGAGIDAAEPSAIALTPPELGHGGRIPILGDGGPQHFSIPERWILTQLQYTADKVSSALASYDMDDACAALYSFFWNDYCDWFLELAKPLLRETPDQPAGNPGARERVQWVLWHVLESALRLMHPIMPFVTEEIWQSIPHEGDTIMRAAYPISDATLIDDSAAAQMETIIAAIHGIRNARGELKIAPSLTLNATIVADDLIRPVIEANVLTIQALARISPPVFGGAAPSGEGNIAVPILAGLDIYLQHAVDVDKETARIDVDIATCDLEILKLETKLANPHFVEKAAPDIVARDRARLAELLDKKAKLMARKAALGG